MPMKHLKIITSIFFLTMIAIVISCKTKKFTTTTSTYDVKISAIAVARGKELVFSSCAGCHYNEANKKFMGTHLLDVPGIIGKVYAANLTQSKSYGIPPLYTNAQLKYMLKTGVARDGRFLPYMLRPNMSEDDLNAIVAYLRSDDYAVTPADTVAGYTHLNLIGRTAMNAAAKPLPYKTGIKTPDGSNQAALGYYLVDNLECFHCHSKSLTSLNALYPNQTKGYLAGGLPLKNHQGNAYKASNITPDKQTGIGNYTQQQFLAALRDGDAPDRKLHAPMPKFKLLKDEEINAIYAYLLTVPAADHQVKHQ